MMLQVEFAATAPDVGQPNELRTTLLPLCCPENGLKITVFAQFAMLLRLTISAEVAAPHCFRRHSEDLWLGNVVFETLVRDEEERTIRAVVNLRQSHWSTEHATKAVIGPIGRD